METVQLQCGNCMKIMAISTEHLGSQVHCPHCRAIVQTPPRAEVQPEASADIPPPPLDIPSPPNLEIESPESIFSSPEETGEDLFGSPPPRIEMPPDHQPPPETTAPPEPYLPPSPPSSYVPAEPTPEPRQPSYAGTEPEPETATATLESKEASELSSFTPPRRTPERSMFVPYLLIFLIPWSIFWPAVAFYFWNELNNRPHSLDMLPDREPAKGGPREIERVKHDLPLEPHQKTVLGSPLRIGDIEVTPLRILRNEEGNLVLCLDLKNVSSNLAFTPISDKFLEVTSRPNSPKPYTFLESQNFTRLYGGHLEWKQGDKVLDWRDADLSPGQQVQACLSTMDKDRKIVRSISRSNDKLLWRVEVRRGLVSHRGKQVPATTVIGVQFSARDIELAGNDDA